MSHLPTKHYFFLILSILGFQWSCSTPPSLPSEIVEGPLGRKIEQQLDPFIQQIMADHDCQSSIAIGVTKGNSIIYAKAFGYANVETRDTADIYSIYHLSSLSKPFVATALVKLQEQERLQLDDPVIKYVPYFKFKTPGYDAITIKQILTHTSGIPSNVGLDEWKNPMYSKDALETYVKGLQEAELIAPPGSKYGYSNTGFNILGDVIAKASGQSFETYLEENVLRPAGMPYSTFLKPDYLPENWAAPHVLGTTTKPWAFYPYNRMYAPSSALHSNVVDMCQWGMINLNHGTKGENHLMDSIAYQQLITPQAATPWGEQIGLSWFLQSYEGMKTILHTGADIGFTSQIIMYPEEQITIVVLANRSQSRVARIGNATIEVIKDLGIKPYQVSGRFPFCREWEEKGFDQAKKLWATLLADTTDNYYADEWELNTIGHGLIFTEEFEKAKQAFDLNIRLFPNSANTYDSYGDALLAEGDTSQAIIYFKKSLEVDPGFSDPKPKLEALGVPLEKEN